MSKEELDGLFRNKLQEHEMEPSSQSWERLESSLPGKERKPGFYYWQAAAAVLILAVAGWLLWPTSADTPRIAGETENGMEQLAESGSEGRNHAQGEKSGSSDTLPAEPKQEQIASSGHSPANEEEPSEEKEADPVKPVAPLRVQPREQIAQQKEKVPVITPEEINQAGAIASGSKEPVKNVSEEAGSASKGSAGEGTASGTLTISIEEFDEALLAEAADSTAEGENSKKGFKKLWAAVKNAPSSLENGLGELREAKNDLLSLEKETDKP